MTSTTVLSAAALTDIGPPGSCSNALHDPCRVRVNGHALRRSATGASQKSAMFLGRGDAQRWRAFLREPARARSLSRSGFGPTAADKVAPGKASSQPWIYHAGSEL